MFKNTLLFTALYIPCGLGVGVASITAAFLTEIYTYNINLTTIVYIDNGT